MPIEVDGGILDALPEGTSDSPIDAVEILLVEDNPDDADLTMRVLTRSRLANRVMWVKDGAEALDFLFSQGEYAHRTGASRPRVVLLDLKLPKLDGIEVLRQIRADAHLATLPVVILTSSNEEADLVAAWASGTNSYVAKPVRFADFEKVISDLGMYWLILNRVPDL